MPRFLAIFSALAFFSQFIFGRAALAANVDTYYGVNDLLQQGVRLGNRDLVTSIAGLINVVLGFLGVIAVLIILYGGYVWITSGGVPDKIQKAKLIIISAVIGLAIVLSAYAISRFIIEQISEGLGVGTPGPVVIIPPGAGSCPEPADINEMLVCQVTPTSGGIGAWVTIRGWHFGAYDPANSYVEFDDGVPERATVVSCNGNITWQQIGPNYYQAIVQVPDVQAAGHAVPGNYDIRVGHTAAARSDVWPDAGPNFLINNATLGPSICAIQPSSGPTGQAVVISGIRFGNGALGDQVFMDSNLGPGQSITVPPAGGWADTQITFNIRPDAISSDVRVQVGGLDSNPSYFTVTCAANADCASNCCSSNTCQAVAVCAVGPVVPSGPHIDSIDPPDGAVSNLVTIYGANFGNTPGSVYFSDGGGNPILANVPNNPQCNALNTWHDTYIIVEVPPNTADGQVSLTTAPPANLNSNAVNFDENGIVRPGLCRVDPLNGIFGDFPINLYGNNFTASDDILFGGISGDNNSINVPAAAATTQVPNLLGGTVAMQIENTVSSQVSNSLPFTVLAVGGGDPVINSISPNPAPPGQYLTIMGANFGDFRGNVTFDAVAGDFNFPAQCNDSIWRSDRIIVKVPAVANGNRPVVVTRNSDGISSRAFNTFTVNSVLSLRPGLCKVEPDNGPVGTIVDFYGDNFGNAQGAGLARFYNNQPADQSAATYFWNNQQVGDAGVPASAETGNVAVVDNDGDASANPINFRVGDCPNDQFCVDNGLGTQCCSGNAGGYCANTCQPVPNQCAYPWTITTQPEPFGLRFNYCGDPALAYMTPTPWPDDPLGVLGLPHTSLDSYVDINLLINFTRDVNDLDLLEPLNFQVIRCNVGLPFNNGACAGGAISGVLSIVNASSDQEGVIFNPDNNLDPDTWYRVDLGGGPNSYRAAVGGDVWPSPSNPAPDYHFKTRTNSDACVPTQVTVSPSNTAVLVPNTRNFTALPTSNNCNICGGNYNWVWSKPAGTDPSPQPALNTIAPLTNNLTPQGSTVLTSGSVTSPGRLQVQASLPDFPAVPAGIAQCEVQVPQLGIVGFGPSCSGACLNSVVYVDFNLDMDPNPAMRVPANFILVDAANPAVNLTTSVSGPARHFVLEHNPLQLNTTYRVTVSGTDVRSADGDTLGADFVWQFSTANSSDCSVTGADVRPDNYTSNILGENVPYSILATNNVNPACGVQVIDCATCSYAWTSSDSAVVTVPPLNIPNNAAQSTGTGNATITGTITQNALTFSDTSDFTVTLPGTFDFSIMPGWQPTGASICMNSSVVVDFSAAVDTSSVTSAMRFYEYSRTGAVGCLDDDITPFGGFFCPYGGSFVFQDIELDGIDPEPESRVIFNPSNILGSSQPYLVLIDSSVQSRDPGGVFVPGALPQIDVDGGGNDGYGWIFNTGSQVCQINFVLISPATDSFTCAYNNCAGDVNGLQAGNQHSYVALPFDINGQFLNAALISYIDWGVVGPLLTLGPNGNQDVEATAANQNGQEVLTVTMSGPTVGSGNGSAAVNLFLCENPWPDAAGPAWNPWSDGTYNFDTFYCQARTASDPVLPDLPYPYSFVHNNVSPQLQREYIFFVDPPIVFNDGPSGPNHFLGTLARADQNVVPGGSSWWQKLSALLQVKKVEGAPGPGQAPQNLAYRVVNTTTIELSWTGVATNGYQIQRKLPTAVIWEDIGAVAETVFTFQDSTLSTGDTYNYRVGAVYNTTISYSGLITVANFNVQQVTQDIIGIRVMRNDGHLSVSDWYRRTAPNSSDPGTLTEIDGYQSLRVGDTTYIAATNVLAGGTGTLYTNIYIVAHNVGARPETVEIYNQLISNLHFNSNIVVDNNNVCRSDVTISCSSDFDCVSNNGTVNEGPCLSRNLKLRRDMQRLGAMLEIQNLMQDYGQSHMACSNSANRSCTVVTQAVDCPSGGTCVPYYPLLNSGSFVRGLSNSSWPLSWDDTLSSVLGTPLPHDPINKFNGCPVGFDRDTCWDEISRQFECGALSLNYFYQNVAGTNYEIADNFEYDLIVPGTFASRLSPDNGVDNIPDSRGIRHLLSNLNSYCNAPIVNPPGPPTSQLCGNGIINAPEQCDGGYQENACDAALGNRNWWTEQRIGCYPRGYRDSLNVLRECTWYVPVPPLSANICGGYCGDAVIQPHYELCEGANFNNVRYSCPGGGPVVCNAQYCQPICPNSGNIAASACGDRQWDQGVEDCDASANPDGMAGFGCTLGGTLRCSNTCVKTCDVGIPTNAVCGNTVNEPAEICDYTTWTPPLPRNSNTNNAYTCSNVCNFTAQPYCGDGIRQVAFGELCDTVYTAPAPGASRQNNQYECGLPPAASACRPEAGGYCGDGTLQNAHGEVCEAATYVAPTPPNSNVNLQYQCSNACVPSTGGYCGDGSVQAPFGEECDPSSSDFLGWSCDDGQPIICNSNCTRRCNAPGVATNSVCGDGNVTGAEQCDWNGFIAPTPANSGVNNQYACGTVAPNQCQFVGGYCGDNTVQGARGESCDGSSYTAPAPRDSTINNQYQCGVTPNPNACAPTRGGYCGDGARQAAFGEGCDPIGYVPPVPTASNATNQYGCIAVPNADACRALIGGYCGDGSIQAANAEECDGAAGMPGWSCTIPAGVISCTGCARVCTQGVPTSPVCGDGNVQGAEQCDPPGNVAGVNPQNSTVNNQYHCDNSCLFDGGYCGNGSVQAPFGEDCDPSGYVVPAPPVSTISNQYGCGAVAAANACRATGGYCGDNIQQSSEYCDGTSWSRTPATSDTNNQYQCSTAAATKCTVTTGGYCRDGVLQAAFGEACDDGNNINNDNCSNLCTFTCVADALGYPSGIVSVASPITFAGNPTVTLLDGQSSMINLPQCRVSGDVVTDIAVDPGTPLGSTLIIIAIDNTVYNQACVSDSNNAAGVGIYPLNINCAVSNFADPNNNLWHYGHTGDLPIYQAIQRNLGPGGILDKMQADDPNMDVTMLHFGSGLPSCFASNQWAMSGPCGTWGINYTLSNDNLRHGQPLFMNIGAARTVMPAWANEYDGRIIGSPSLGDYVHPYSMLAHAGYLFNLPAAAGYSHKKLIVIGSNHDGLGLDLHNYDWNDTVYPVTIDDIKALGVEVITLSFSNGEEAGAEDLQYFSSLYNYLSSNSCQCSGVYCYDSTRTCGDGLVQCGSGLASVAGWPNWPPNPAIIHRPRTFEECDGQPGCDASCKWTNRSRARMFSVRDDSSFAANWMLNIPPGAFVSPPAITSIEVNVNGGLWQDMGLPTSLPGTISNARIDTRVLNATSCTAASPPNNLPFSLRFNAGAASDASATFQSADYNYCRW